MENKAAETPPPPEAPDKAAEPVIVRALGVVLVLPDCSIKTELFPNDHKFLDRESFVKITNSRDQLVAYFNKQHLLAIRWMDVPAMLVQGLREPAGAVATQPGNSVDRTEGQQNPTGG